MQDTPNSFDHSLTGLDQNDWTARIGEIAEEHGFVEPLGPRHSSLFIEGTETLLVTFETIQGIRTLSDTAQPLGWDIHKAMGWSHLALLSDGDTWFRDAAVFDHLDRLTDDGFFDEYDHVLFYGAGPCGYAAAAFSVVAPGATVLAVQPQATLDPRIAGWDDRFTEMRRTDFSGRYGYAPDMLDAAGHAYLIFDPAVTLDAMHAALFTRPSVTMLRVPHMGEAVQSELIDMQVLYRIVARAGAGKLDPGGFAQLMRARRNHGPYLRRLMARLDADERHGLVRMLCRNVTARMHAPRFKRRLDQIEALEG